MKHSLLLHSVVVGLVLTPTLIVAQTVSFTAEAQPVTELIRAINARFETEYSVSGSLRGEIVCVQVTDVPLNKLLEKIAEVTASRWVRKGGTVTLEPSAALRAKERRAEIDYKRSYFELQLEKYAPVWQKTGIDPKINERLPLDGIAAQPAWTVEVYAVSPTKGQKRLDRGLPALMGTGWIKEMPKGKSQTNVTVGPYEDLHLVSRHMGARVEISLEATDAKGAVISRTSLSLRLSTGVGKAVRTRGIDESRVVALDPVRRAFVKLWGTAPPMGKSEDVVSIANFLSIDPSLRPEVEKLVCGPTDIEPLSVFVSPVLNEASRIEGLDLVALLPDSAVLLGNYINRSPQIEAPGALVYLQGSVMQSRSSDGWTLMTPLFPSQARSDRMDRGELRKLVLDVRNTGGLDPVALIAALPDQAVERTDLMQGMLGYYDVGVASAAAASFTSEFSTFEALATIPKGLLQTAMSGTSVTLDRRSVATMRSVSADILSRRMALSQARPPDSSLAETAVSNVKGLGSDGSLKTIEMMVSPPIEVTDLLSSGVLAIELQIDSTVTRDIQGRSTSRGFMQRSSLDMMAWAAANASRGKTNRNTDGLLVSAEFMLIKRTYWTITYRLPDGLTARTKLSWIDPDLQGGWRPFASIGPAYMEQYNRAYQGSLLKIEYMGKKGDAGGKGGGGKIPPP